jgi:putative addiction module antidote
MTVVTRVILRDVGDSLGVTLPGELIDDLRLEAGDEMLVMEADKGIYLSPSGSPFKQAFDEYQRLGREYQTALEELNRPLLGRFPATNGNGRH